MLTRARKRSAEESEARQTDQHLLNRPIPDDAITMSEVTTLSSSSRDEPLSVLGNHNGQNLARKRSKGRQPRPSGKENVPVHPARQRSKRIATQPALTDVRKALFAALPVENNSLQTHPDGDEDYLKCAVYADDIYNTHLENELQKIADPMYMTDVQKSISLEERNEVVDSMVDFALSWNLEQETLYLAINYFDRYLSTEKVANSYELRLIGGTCLFVAAKYEEIQPPALNDVVIWGVYAFTCDQLKDQESKLLNALNFELTVTTPQNFLEMFLDRFGADDRTRKLAQYLCELASIDYSFIRFSASVLASAALILASRRLSKLSFRKEVWSDSREVLRPCVYQLLETWHVTSGKPHCVQGQSAVAFKYNDRSLRYSSLLAPVPKLVW